MIKIGICDDEKRVADFLKNHIEKYIQEMNVECEITTYLFGEDVLKYAGEIDILFLDIEMPEMDGIETGKTLKEKNPDCVIIMATGNTDRFKETFKISAYRYITKPFEEEEIKEALQASFARMIGRSTIEVFSDRVSYKIVEKDICYVRAYNGYTLIVAKGTEYRSELSLKEYEEILDKRIFFKTSRSWLVNLLKVEKHIDGKFYLEEVPVKVSRRNQKEFLEKYIRVDTEFRG